MMRETVISSARSVVMPQTFSHSPWDIRKKYGPYSDHGILQSKSRTKQMPFMATLLASNSSASLEQRVAVANGVNKLLSRKETSKGGCQREVTRGLQDLLELIGSYVYMVLYT